MTQTSYITISVNELKPGMLVHSIAEQSGKLKVKNRGKINHPAIIKQLESCGVKKVVVERMKKVSFEAIEALNQRKDEINAKRMSKPKARRIVHVEDKFVSDKPVPQSYADELSFAERVVDQLKETFNIQRLRADKGLSVEIEKIDYLVQEVFESLARDPNALLCISMIRNNGDYLKNHAAHCAVLMCYFAQQLGMSHNECAKLTQMAYFFDVGMAKIPQSITHSADSPSIDEQLIIQSHVHHSLEFVETLRFDKEQMLAIEQHHERLDGSGYPFGLEGEQIHKYSRMLAIVDCFDAMTTNRPFQKSVSAAAALKIICNPDYGYDQKLAVKFLRAIGVYPVGCVVALSNKKIALVTKMNPGQAVKPIVKTLFSLKSMDYCLSETIDLSDPECEVKVTKPVFAAHYGIDLAKFEINNENGEGDKKTITNND